MPKINKNFLAFLFFTLAFYSSLDAQKLNIKNYSIDDGIPQAQVQELFQDHTGAIWLATNNGGISCFDGLVFKNYSTKDGLNHNNVFSFFEDSKNVLWVGTQKGLNKFSNKKFETVSDTLINNLSIYCIQQHANGELWFGTNSGIIITDGKKFRPFNFNNQIGNHQITSIKQDIKGNTWIGTMSNGVFYFNGNSLIHLGINEGLSDSKVSEILIDNNKLWVANARGINTLDLSKVNIGYLRFDTLKLNGNKFFEATHKIYKDKQGTIWLGYVNGVVKIKNGKSTFISKNNGLCNPLIYAIIQDSEGNMWFGSFFGGLSRYFGDLFININEQQGLTNNSVTAFLKDSNDNLWIGTSGGGVSKMDYKAWKFKDTIIFKNIVQQKDGLASNSITGICEDKRGNIWFATSGSGVSRYDGKNFTNFDVHNGLDGLTIHDILADKDGVVWIASEKGVTKYDGNSFVHFDKLSGMSPQGVLAMYEDDSGNIWFGSEEKLNIYDGKNFSGVMRAEGFRHLRSIFKDKLGYVWVSTDAGASVNTGKFFRAFTESDGLISNNVQFIKSDFEGNIWFGTNKGLDKLDLDFFVNQKEVVLKHYRKEEGFLGGECNANAFFKDVDGKLWIGTKEGIVIYDPKNERTNSVESKLQITGIRLFLEEVDLAKYGDSTANGISYGLKLPYDKNHITFDFIGISQTNPQNTKYQYKLIGADINWSPRTNGMSATYSNLPAGEYTFLLKASNSDGLWNSSPLSYSFEIVPPFWRRAWFYFLIVFCAFSFFYLIIKIRERRLIYSQKVLERQVQIRTRELSEEKEKLQEAYTEIGEKNKSITDSILYAKRLQNALLPPDSTVNQLFPQSFVLFKPKDIVSGDFYWMEQWGHQTLLAAADCTGHGVPGAFMSIVGHNILTQSVNVLGLSKPALILNETNKQLSRKLNQNPEEATVRDGMDIALCAINYTKSTVEFAGANKPVWIIRNGEVIEVKGNKFPIGAYVGEELQKFTNHEWELQKGDCLYIFSDGFADQFGGPKGKKFKYKQLQQIILDNHKKPPIEQKNILEKAFNEWKEGFEQIDDVLVIGVRL